MSKAHTLKSKIFSYPNLKYNCKYQLLKEEMCKFQKDKSQFYYKLLCT